MRWFVEHWISLIPFCVLVAFFSAPLFWYLIWGRRRPRALRGVAERMGAFFRPGVDPKVAEEVPQFAGSQMRLPLTGFNTMRLAIPVLGHPADALLGDCAWVTRTDQWLAYVTNPDSSYAALRLPIPGVPDLMIRPTAAAYKNGERPGPAFNTLGLGMTRVEFESAAFNHLYEVHCTYRRFAYDIVTAPMMELLLETRPPQIFIQGGWFMLGGEQGQRWPARRFAEVADWMARFFALWPHFVLADRAGPSHDAPHRPPQPTPGKPIN